MDRDPPAVEVEEIADINRAGTPVRLYRPYRAHSTIVYIHGGGFVMGTLDTYQDLCTRLAVEAGAVVAAVDYLHAPRAHHPFQIGEVWAMLRWLWRRAIPVALAGDGAGAYLAVQVAARAAQCGGPLSGLGLIYPTSGPGGSPGGPGPAPHWSHYLGDTRPSQAQPPVGLTDLDLTGLPPTMVVEDPVRPDYVTELLAAAGVAVTGVRPVGPAVDFLLPSVDTSEVLCPLADFLSEALSMAHGLYTLHPPGAASTP